MSPGIRKLQREMLQKNKSGTAEKFLSNSALVALLPLISILTDDLKVISNFVY
jgi:hypothetical protein